MHPDKDHGCKILSEHFNSPLCKGFGYMVQVLEVVPGVAKGRDGKLDPNVTKLRKAKEKGWMLKLRTVYPYGLNDMIGDEYRYNITTPIGTFFPSLSRKDNLHVRKRIPSKINASLDNFLLEFDRILRNNLKSAMNYSRIFISSLKRSTLISLGNMITDYLARQGTKFPFLPWYEACIDIISTKIYKPPAKNIKKKPENNLCVFFHNKSLDFINLPKIVNNRNIVNLLPDKFDKKHKPTVLYKLNNTIRAKIFNYKHFMADFDINSFVEDNTILPCHCEGSPYQDIHHGHIITGDLRIVNDNKLRKLLCKGPKYREPITLDFDLGKSNILIGLTECVNNLSCKYKIAAHEFQNWLNAISLEVDTRIEQIKNNIDIIKHKSVLNNSSSKRCLEELQNNFVMVPIDKAANNVAFICKRYYAIVLLKELGLYGTSSPTYERINIPISDVVSNHCKLIYQKFRIKTEDDFKLLPSIYWLPKMHKTPIKSRFIIASKTCTTKQLSKYVASVFSKFLQQVHHYHSKSFFFSGIKTFWVIQNNKPILDSITIINKRKSARKISNFDFSTLYTMLPHDKLTDVLIKIIDFCFKGHTQDKIYINNRGEAIWTLGKNNNAYSFTKNSLIDAVKILIDNCHFMCGNYVFRQTIGIPIGGDPAPHWANLFLFNYESKFILDLKKSDPIRARKFRHIYRYIDDLQTINDGGEFEKCIKDIYPQELVLNKENREDTTSSFLDLSLQVKEGKIVTTLFDKRDEFSFSIVRLPYLSSNIPQKMFYSSIGAELLRICRVSSSIELTRDSLSSLLTRAIHQGADKDKLLLVLRSTLNKHPDVFLKFEGQLNIGYLNALCI